MNTVLKVIKICTVFLCLMATKFAFSANFKCTLSIFDGCDFDKIEIIDDYRSPYFPFSREDGMTILSIERQKDGTLEIDEKKRDIITDTNLSQCKDNSFSLSFTYNTSYNPEGTTQSFLSHIYRQDNFEDIDSENCIPLSQK